MSKDNIISEICRIAALDGKPSGAQRFSKITGIKKSAWYGRYWAKWSDAISEAGLTPNKLQGPTDIEIIINAYISLVEELGHIPSNSEIRLKSTTNPDFPSHTVFANRLGRKNELLRKVIDYASKNSISDVTISQLESAFIPEQTKTEFYDSDELRYGFVYLMKSGKHYKIGRTNALDRRQYEIGIQLPEKIEPIHSIETDDPSGIEAYWHNRFKDKRLNGEWFALTTADVKTFRKRKFM